jgi:hypothetical protein
VPVHQQLRRLRQALNRPQPLAVRRQAVQLTGVLAGIAGNLALDLHRESQAESYFDVAEIAGREAEDATSAPGPWQPAAWSRSSTTARRTPSTTRPSRQRCTRRLQPPPPSLDRRSPRPRRTADGDAKAALTHLDVAHAALAVAGSPEGNDFFDEARLTGFTGATMLQLRRADEASDLLTESVRARPTGDAKGRALATLDLASCRLIVGEAEEAAQLVEHALSLARGGVVGPIVSRARSVRADMMAVDQISAARIAQLLREVASRADRQE